ncbi:Amino acid permease family protein [Trifolium repens]|nr:Amino acid permease family protein [Trifolium repens]
MDGMVLFLDYLKSAIPVIGNGFPRIIAVLVLTLVLTYMNYRGLTIVGWAAILLGIFSLSPFVVMGLISIPRIKPKRWVVVDLKSVNWGLYLSTLFWNLNYWDSVSTLAGEVNNPESYGLMVTFQKLVKNTNILKWSERLYIAVDAAHGLDYLHNGF